MWVSSHSGGEHLLCKDWAFFAERGDCGDIDVNSGCSSVDFSDTHTCLGRCGGLAPCVVGFFELEALRMDALPDISSLRSVRNLLAGLAAAAVVGTGSVLLSPRPGSGGADGDQVATSTLPEPIEAGADVVFYGGDLPTKLRRLSTADSGSAVYHAAGLSVSFQEPMPDEPADGEPVSLAPEAPGRGDEPAAGARPYDDSVQFDVSPQSDARTEHGVQGSREATVRLHDAPTTVSIPVNVTVNNGDLSGQLESLSRRVEQLTERLAVSEAALAAAQGSRASTSVRSEPMTVQQTRPRIVRPPQPAGSVQIDYFPASGEPSADLPASALPAPASPPPAVPEVPVLNETSNMPLLPELAPDESSVTATEESQPTFEAIDAGPTVVLPATPAAAAFPATGSADVAVPPVAGPEFGVPGSTESTKAVPLTVPAIPAEPAVPNEPQSALPQAIEGQSVAGAARTVAFSTVVGAVSSGSANVSVSGSGSGLPTATEIQRVTPSEAPELRYETWNNPGVPRGGPAWGGTVSRAPVKSQTVLQRGFTSVREGVEETFDRVPTFDVRAPEWMRSMFRRASKPAQRVTPVVERRATAPIVSGKGVVVRPSSHLQPVAPRQGLVVVPPAGAVPQRLGVR
jgi:hypothetical protein